MAKKRTVASAFTSVVGNFADLGRGLTNMVSSAVFGRSRVKKSQKVLSESPDDLKLANHPLMKGFLSLITTIDEAAKGKTADSSETEYKTKERVAEILIHMLNQRQDFLIQNFLRWFDKIITKEGKEFSQSNILEITETLMKYIDTEGYTVLPTVMLTGIEDVDHKNLSKSRAGRVWNKFKGIFKKGKNNQAATNREFINYTSEPDFPDLDKLIFGSDKQNAHHQGVEALPSLLITFVNTDDIKLQHHLLELIMKSFNQKQELMDNLQTIEVLFEDDDIYLYSKMKTKLEELRFIAERSEVNTLTFHKI